MTSDAAIRSEKHFAFYRIVTQRLEARKRRVIFSLLMAGIIATNTVNIQISGKYRPEFINTFYPLF